MPRNLVAASRSEGRLDWLATLPTTVALVADRWGLSVQEPFQPGGHTAWVAPAVDDSGAHLVLKVGWRHTEAVHEGDGLRRWNGDGAVHVHATHEFDDMSVLLLEHCVPGTTLTHRPEPEQDIIIAGLLQRLWVEPTPGHPFRPLQLMCDEWADEFEHKPATAHGLDPGLAREAITLFRALPSTADRTVLLCTDLHADNVLATQREPWLAIDPKPYAGDPTYDALQHLLVCGDRLRAGPVDLTYRMADLCGLDRDRLLLWLFARCVQESPGWPGLAEVAQHIAPA